jgi:hypothetical protein
MPAFIHSRAMKYYMSAINENALTSLQLIWFNFLIAYDSYFLIIYIFLSFFLFFSFFRGGTHDALLGLLFWMYSLPVYSMACCYKETQMTVERNLDRVVKYNNVDNHPRSRISNDIFIVHRVKNMRTGKKGQLSIPSQYDIAQYFGDTYRDNTSSSSSSIHLSRELKTNTTIKDHQYDIGFSSVSKLIRMEESSVNNTLFSDKARNLRKNFIIFTSDFCRTKS